MKVLIITNQYPTSSKPETNPAVYFQVLGLRKTGVEADVYHIDRSNKGVKEYINKVMSILRLWKLGSYDLLHIQFGGLQSLIGALIAGKHALITYHGTDLHGGSPQNIKSKIYNQFNVTCSRWASFLAGGVSVVSPSLLKFLPKTIVHRTKVIPPGVDYESFKPTLIGDAREKLGLNNNLKYVLFSDISGSPVKRRDIALAVEERLKFQDPKIRLLIMTNQPYWNVPTYLNASNCLLLTSDKEGSPNIVKEALAVNLPIVSVDVGDIRLRCEGVTNCQIVERDIDKLALAVLHAIQIGREGGGRELKRHEIDNEKICRDLCSLYKQIAGD